MDPDGSFGKVSAAPPLAPARACELWVGRRGWPLSTHPEGELRLPAPAARFVSPAGTGSRKPCWTLSPFDPSRSFRIACAPHPAGRSPGGPLLGSRSRALARPFPRTRDRTLSVSSFPLRAALACRHPLRFPLCLRAAFHFRFASRLRVLLGFRSSRAPLFPETSAAPGRHFGFATCTSFRIPEPFPNAVSRRHLHRFRSV